MNIVIIPRIMMNILIPLVRAKYNNMHIANAKSNPLTKNEAAKIIISNPAHT